MQFSPIDAMLWAFSLPNIFTLVAAAPTPAVDTPTGTSLDSRQMSGNIFYGDACKPNTPLRTWFPDACWLTVVQTDPFHPHADPKTSLYESSIFLFDMACNIIGYMPNAGNIEDKWVSFDSQLPYTIDIRTWWNVPQFNYAGQHYDGNYQNGYVEQWYDNDSGNNERNWRFLVFCGRDGKRDVAPQIEPETPSAISSPSIMSRQASSLCNPNDVFGQRAPGLCWLTFQQKRAPFTYDTTLNILRTNCNSIGYIAHAGDLEAGWISMDSQLPYTVDITT